MVLNFLVHFGLCEEGLVLLVVPKSSVSDDIDENVFLEFLFISDCDLHASVKQVRLVCIYVNYRRTDDFGNLGAVI